MHMQEMIRQIAYGTADILLSDELNTKLQQTRPLRIKAGFDPTAADLHLGHTVLINKLRTFQDMGHEILFLIGDFTAMIGDPTGKNTTRPPLSETQVLANAQSYAQQVYKILDPSRTQIVYNSTWLKHFSAKDLVHLAAQHTVARMLEREDFAKRYQSGQAIALHEFLYPLLQGYDSVHLKADIELGGTDQTFNLLVGRELQKQAQQSPQVVITLPLLEGLDGVKKMSKSLNNYIGIEECPNSMFGKLMSISDKLMWRYYQLLSLQPIAQIEQYQQQALAGANPRIFKVQLAKELISRFHDHNAAEAAHAQFEQQFQRKQIPDELEEYHALCQPAIGIAQLLKAANLTQSTSEALRLLKQGAVKINGDKVEDSQITFGQAQTLVLQVGKRRFKRIILS